MGLFGSGKKDKNKNVDNGNVTLSSGDTISIANAVDCLGDSCPRPQLMTKKAVTNASSGEVVSIAVDNPTSMEALPPMCAALGATHLETVAGNKGWHVYIQKN